MNLTDCLTEWLKTFECNSKFNCSQDLCDGVIIANILFQIQSEFFTFQWLSKIDTDIECDWKAKESNLRNISEKLSEYYIECLGKRIPEIMVPNVTKIAMFFDSEQIGLLLQLVLGCVINGPNTSYFIQIMNELTSEIQEGLKTAIQNLDYNIFDEIITDSGHLSISKKCHELKELVIHLKENIHNLKEENDMLGDELNKSKEMIESFESKVPKDKDIVSSLRQTIDTLKDDLLNSEEMKERVDAKCGLLEAEVKSLRRENERLKFVKQNTDDKDRIRYLEEELQRAKHVNQLQLIKIEEMRNKIVENEAKKIDEIVHKKLVESMKDCSNENNKLKKMLKDLRVKVEEEIFRADKAEDKYLMTYERYLELIDENEKVVQELRHIKHRANDSYKNNEFNGSVLSLTDKNNNNNNNININNVSESGNDFDKTRYSITHLQMPGKSIDSLAHIEQKSPETPGKNHMTFSFSSIQSEESGKWQIFL